MRSQGKWIEISKIVKSPQAFYSRMAYFLQIFLCVCIFVKRNKSIPLLKSDCQAKEVLVNIFKETWQCKLRNSERYMSYGEIKSDCEEEFCLYVLGGKRTKRCSKIRL